MNPKKKADQSALVLFIASLVALLVIWVCFAIFVGYGAGGSASSSTSGEVATSSSSEAGETIGLVLVYALILVYFMLYNIIMSVVLLVFFILGLVGYSAVGKGRLGWAKTSYILLIVEGVLLLVGGIFFASLAGWGYCFGIVLLGLAEDVYAIVMLCLKDKKTPEIGA